MHVSDSTDNSLTGGQKDGHGEGERHDAGHGFGRADGEGHDGDGGDARASREDGDSWGADGALPPDLEPVLGGIDEPREAFDPDEARGITLEGVREPMPADASFDPESLPEREPLPEIEVEAWADEDMAVSDSAAESTEAGADAAEAEPGAEEEDEE